MPGLEKESMLVNFSLDMNMPSNTKAGSHTWGDNSNLNADDNYPESVGDTFENKIKTDHLLVFAYKPDGTFVGHLPILKAGVSEDGVVNFTCALKYSVHQQSGTDEYKFVVLANCIDKAYGFMYNEDGSPNIDAQMYSMPLENIPMWGVQSYEITYDGSVLRKKQDIGEISLLRATSKIGVRLSDELQAEGFRIKPGSVKLNYARPNGYSAPKNWNEVENTKALTHEDSFNPTSSSKVALSKDVEANAYGMTTNSYYLYVPETLNNDPNFQAGEDGVSELSMCIAVEKVENGEVVETYEFQYEKGIKFRTYVDGLPDGEAFNITRNHFYDYKITKINTTIKLELVEYSALPWVEKEVQIGDVTKYLVLNTDLVKMYSTNVDATTLKFISSSPIKRVELKDTYSHDVRSNTFTKYQGDSDETDRTYAYYVTKYGQIIQLGQDPGFSIGSDDAAKLDTLQRELVILKNINAVAEEKVLQGGITINSPFMDDESNENEKLRTSSHFNTIRYLEFEVENEQGLIEVFRVMQYPPVVINNIEGYFSYRDDHKDTDDEEPAHYLNFKRSDNMFLSGLMLYHVHDWTNEAKQSETWWATPQPERSYAWLVSCPTQGTGDDGWEELRYGYGRNTVTYGTTTKTYSGAHRSVYHPTDRFLRHRFKGLPGVTETNMNDKGAAVGPYYDEVDENGNKTGRVLRKHYVWNLQPVFYPRFVGNVHLVEESVNIVKSAVTYATFTSNGKTSTQMATQNEYTTDLRKPGMADIYKVDINDEGTGWDIWPAYTYKYTWVYQSSRWRSTTSGTAYKVPSSTLVNHRMYHIQINSTSADYTLGRVTLVDENGNPTSSENENGVVENTTRNAALMSPSLAVASQLGETEYETVVKTAKQYNYIVPSAKKLYEMAERHCKHYVETSYEDANHNNKYDEGEVVHHYKNWRLPTKTEIETIIRYQNNSRSVDRLLSRQYYFCVTGNADSDDVSNIFNWVSSEVPGFDTNSTGYYIRCVRDVFENEKPNENTKALVYSPLLK